MPLAISGPSLTIAITHFSPSASVTAAAGAPTTVPSTNGTEPSAYNFTCGPTEGDLTYGITVATLEGVSLAEATEYFGNWTGSA